MAYDEIERLYAVAVEEHPQLYSDLVTFTSKVAEQRTALPDIATGLVDSEFTVTDAVEEVVADIKFNVSVPPLIADRVRRTKGWLLPIQHGELFQAGTHARDVMKRRR